MSELSPAKPSIDVFALVARHWKTCIVCGVLGLSAGLSYALLAPKWYEATLTVVPSQRSQDSAATSLASKLPFGVDSVSTDVQRINAVFTSRSVADEVIEKFQLEARYGTEYREQTRKALAKHCSSRVDKKSSMVALTCEDNDPKLAKEMASYFGQVGNRVFRRVSASSATEERKFLETQVMKARADVDVASRKLREFQEKHKIVDLPEQSKAVISAMASIQADIVSKQLELNYLSSFASRTESNVVQLQKQISILEQKLKQLESAQKLQPATTQLPNDGNFFPDAMNVPGLRFELEQLIREQKIQETVFFLMTQRYEMAKIDEARDTSTFQILDEPTVPTYRSRPNGMKAIAGGGVAGLAVAGALIFLPLWWRRRATAR